MVHSLSRESAAILMIIVNVMMKGVFWQGLLAHNFGPPGIILSAAPNVPSFLAHVHGPSIM